MVFLENWALVNGISWIFLYFLNSRINEKYDFTSLKEALNAVWDKYVKKGGLHRESKPVTTSNANNNSEKPGFHVCHMMVLTTKVTFLDPEVHRFINLSIIILDKSRFAYDIY